MVKKVTPKHDLSWYIKWVSSFLILIAICLRSGDTEGVFKIYDLSLSLTGTLGWCSVGLLWHDRALIVLNGAASMALAIGLIKLITTV